MKIANFIVQVLLIFLYCNLSSQVVSSKYYIELTDKENSSYTIEKPEEFLTNKSIQRRTNQNIDIEYSDLPISQFYIDSLKKLGLNILLKSKWFNAVTVETLDSILMDTITNLSFVKNSIKLLSIYEEVNEKADNNNEIDEVNNDERGSVRKSKTIIQNNFYDYGDSKQQVYLHNGQFLHDKSYRGKGMVIAITDTGFDRVPAISSFDDLFIENRILKTKNFVYGGDDVYNYHTHGTLVLSAMAANFPGYLIGTAPEAEYMLFITEDTRSETLIEELYWVSAAELADSLGADIINVSLGYFKFDDPEFDYTYEDLDGKTAIMSIAANMASQKGMIIVVAGGNSGRSKENPHIGVPADANEILAVGAILKNKEIATISSIGPSADGRIKPDVVAVGIRTAVQHINDSVSNGFGTSFAAPIISGLAACLWQKFPHKTNLEIIEAIKISSSHYLNPDNSYGYGLPDMKIASAVLKSPELYPSNIGIRIFPNPFAEKFSVTYPNYMKNQKIEIILSDISGRIIYNKVYPAFENIYNYVEIDELKNIQNGYYLVSIIGNKGKYSQIIVKN